MADSEKNDVILLEEKHELEVESIRSKGNKYEPSLRTIIPIRGGCSNDKRGHPNDNAGLLSTILFSWLTTLILKVFKKTPTEDDLWKISKYDETAANYKRLKRFWEEELRSKGAEKASMWRVNIRFIRLRLTLIQILTIIYIIIYFISSSFIVRLILRYVAQINPTLGYGLLLVGVYAMAECLRASLLALVFAINYRSAIRNRSAILMLVFRKVLKLSSTSGSVSVGELINICSNDGDKVFEAHRISCLVTLGPILFISGSIFCTYLIGPTGLVGALVFILVVPIQAFLAKVLMKLRVKVLKNTELRLKKIQEILSSIKLIKMYAWEDSFMSVVTEIRNKELKYLKWMTYISSVNISIAFLTPALASVAMLSAFVALGHNLTPADAFTCIAVFNAMSTGLKFLPMSIKSLVEVNVSMARFKKILTLETLDEYVATETGDPGVAVEIQGASLAWPRARKGNLTDSETVKPGEVLEKDGLLGNNNENSHSESMPTVLENINLSVKKGHLVGVCGAVGSGKSSLIGAIMGHLKLEKGTAAVSGSVAYVSQQAWLMNSTIRENILFGSKYEESRYTRIVAACGLAEDFNSFPSGDLLEVGERGINMSGGQKQRISLSRALYKDSEVYLLDDPLSAVDAHVGKHIFTNAVTDLLVKRGKTVVLVTHQLQYLPACDKVYLMEDGKLTETSDFEPMIVGKIVEESKDISDKVGSSTSISTLISEEKLYLDGKLMSDEERGEVVPCSTYFRYMEYAGGTFLCFLIFLFFALNVGMQQFSNFWLSYWLKQGSGRPLRHPNFTAAMNYTVNLTLLRQQHDILKNPHFSFYMMVYVFSAVAMLVISLTRGYCFISVMITATKNLHANLFKNILYGRMSFFDTTPSGRIMNRFQKDCDEVDQVLTYLAGLFFYNFFILIYAAGLVSYVVPKFLVVLAIVIPIYFATYFVFKPTAREMRRLDILTRSPWFSLITTAVTGLDTIRAYNQSKDFVSKFRRLMDKNSSPYYLFACANRWLAVRLDFLTVCTGVFTIILLVLNQGLVSPAFAGLAIMSSFLMSGMLQFTTRVLIESEARFVAVDRIIHYIDNVPQENLNEVSVRENWPHSGAIEFKNVKLKYRTGLPLVLKDISFRIKAKEKIGIVGRTGSGKSSLTVALFRLVGIESGLIAIDDVDISKISIHNLRSTLSIIPQDPVLFSGTVRYNLDPFNNHSDNELWSALDQTHLKNAIQNIPGQLECNVQEDGSNFSIGERQLLCLARALLRRSKILILDEATAAVDSNTEKIVHDMMKETFADCTVLMIAHRVSTVDSCDRVMVMSEGRIKEFEKPEVLKSDPNSYFSRMLKTFS